MAILTLSDSLDANINFMMCKLMTKKSNVTKPHQTIPCLLQLRLDLAVGVVDDGQEHVEKDEEGEEDVVEEENWPCNK